jgi:YggT family protein
MGVVRIVAGLASALLSVMQVAMLIRAILSWFPQAADSAFGDLIATVTEPVVAPIRALADRFGWFRNSPIDFSFMIAYLLLFVLQGMISGFTTLLF